MPIDIYFVKEDLLAIEHKIGSFNAKDFEDLINVSKQLNLTLIPTIDSLGITVINCLHISPLKKELTLLHGNYNASKVVLDLLDIIVRGSNKAHSYVKFVGSSIDN